MIYSAIEKTISKWLVDQNLTASLDPYVTFSMIGLNSIDSVELANFLGKELKLELDETIVFSYPTVQALARYIFDRIAAPQDDSYTGEGVATFGESAHNPGHW